MPQFFIILLKINFVLILFGAAYYLILRRLTFYTINRVFLVFGMLFATAYPFIDLTAFFHQQDVNAIAFVPQLNQDVAALVPSKFIALNWQILTVIFYVGVILMALRLFVQFVSLYKMHQKSAPGSIADFPVRILSESVSPFSFWQTVYVNPSLHKESELETIIAHENIHVKQWHSLDIILAELSVVFYWFNPGIWLMKKAVKENLEFITDQKILNKGIDKRTYQYSLLDVGNLTPAVEIVNNFNLSDLKKRIKMMNAKRSSKLSLSSYLFILPVLLITTLAFTVSKKDVTKHFEPIRQALTKTSITDSVKLYLAIVPEPRSANQNISKITDLKRSVKFKGSANKGAKIKDTVNAILPSLSNDNALVLTIKDLGYAGRLQGKVSGVMMVKKDSLPFNSDKVVQNLKIAFAGSEKPVGSPESGLRATVVVRGFKIGTKLSDSLNKTDFFFNGKKITQEELSKIEPETIKSVNVTKSKEIGEIRIIGIGKKNQ